MVILRTRNKFTDFLMILAWASPFKQIFLTRQQKKSIDQYCRKQMDFLFKIT